MSEIITEVKADYVRAHTFCRLFKGIHTFQTFDDTGNGREDLLRIIHAQPHELRATLIELKALNDQGAGIFFTVNLTDGRGRKADNVIGLRALFVDGDDVPMPAHWHATPDMVTHRSTMRWHAYWFLKPETPLDTFRPAQKKLAAFYNTDRAVHDLSRVMRVPGFIHRKGEPCEVFMEVR